jgi:hypothetical protein
LAAGAREQSAPRIGDIFRGESSIAQCECGACTSRRVCANGPRRRLACTTIATRAVVVGEKELCRWYLREFDPDTIV